MHAIACRLTVVALATLFAFAAPAAADHHGHAPESRPDAEPAPLKALYVTGGGWHDYATQERILTEGLGERVRVEWTVEREAEGRSNHWPERFTQEDWMKGYDVVVYNFCITDVADAKPVDDIVAMHVRLKVPAVFIHCAIHSFRAPTTKWFEFGGVRSHRHEAHRPYKVEPIAEHPIMTDFPADGWQTPQGELYEIEELYGNTKPLARAYGVDTEKHHVVIWTNEFQNIRVFGTTVGHHNETMQEKVYLDYVARGLLWSVDKLQNDGSPAKGYAPKPDAEAQEPAQDDDEQGDQDQGDDEQE